MWKDFLRVDYLEGLFKGLELSNNFGRTLLRKSPFLILQHKYSPSKFCYISIKVLPHYVTFVKVLPHSATFVKVPHFATKI